MEVHADMSPPSEAISRIATGPMEAAVELPAAGVAGTSCRSAGTAAVEVIASGKARTRELLDAPTVIASGATPGLEMVALPGPSLPAAATTTTPAFTAVL